MSQELRPEPWLVYIDKNNSDDTETFCNLSNGGHVVRNVPESMRNKIFLSCSPDWCVLIHRRKRDCTLVNPRTMESFWLPSLRGFTGVLSGAVSTFLSSIVVVLMTCGDTSSKKVSFLFCKLGDDNWTKQDEVDGARCICQDYNPDNQTFPRFRVMASFDDQIYVISSCCRTLCKFQFDEEHCSIRLLDLNLRKPDTYENLINITFYPIMSLVQYSQTELMIVEIYANGYREDIGVFDNDCRGVELYTVNLQDKVWTRLQTLPQDTAVFIGTNFSNILLCNGVRGGNTVYFKRSNDKYLYAYDVREKSITVSLPSPDVKHYVLQAVWVPPLCSLSSTVDDGDADTRMQVRETMIVVFEDRWCNIPIHLLSYIQSLLFGADRCCFSLVCKTWQLAFSAETTSMTNMGGHGFPMLLHIGNNYDHRVGIFDPITNSRSTLHAPDLVEGVIRCSKHGWLLVTEGSYGTRIFFYNPFTEQRIDLPKLLTSKYNFDGITFTSPPTSPDCMVFGYSISSPDVTLSYLYRGKDTWLNCEMGIDKIGSHKSYANLVYHRGKFCFIPKQRYPDFTSQPCSSMRRTNVVECDGKLLLVATAHLGRFVQVFELNEDDMVGKDELVQVLELNEDAMVGKEPDNLGDMMLFVSSGGSTLSATCKGVEVLGLGNKVFLDRFNGEDGVFYSLATKKFHTFWSGYNSHDWCDTKEYTHRDWIQPNFEVHTEEQLQWV